LPDDIQRHVGTILAWDNVDILEETLSGEGISHRVNGIAVQARHFGRQLLLEPLTQISKTNAEDGCGPRSRFLEVTRQEALENERRKNPLRVLVPLHPDASEHKAQQ